MAASAPDHAGPQPLRLARRGASPTVAGLAGTARQMRAALLAATALAVASGAAAQPLRVVTYNVFGGGQDAAAIAATILRLEPDIVALQELSPSGAEQIDRAVSSTLPFRYFPMPSQGGGLALAARFPLERTLYRPSPHGANGFVIAEVVVDGRRLEVANLHLDPLKTWTLGQKLTLPWQVLRHGGVHRSELAAVFGELRPGAPVLVVGDLNSYVSEAAPIWLINRGLVDSFAAVTPPGEWPATHHFTLAGFRLGKRIDFIFHSLDLRTLDSRVVPGTPSDHDVVVSTLQWAQP